MPQKQTPTKREKNYDPSSSKFKNLSLKDVIEARDVFHVHLMHKANVVATAVGRYLIRNSDMKDGVYRPDKSFPRKPRRLDNSSVYDFSWSCVLVFVERWQDEGSLIHRDGDNLVPKSIYMPDGRVIPICIVEAPKFVADKEETVNIDDLIFPVNKIGGGFPAIIESQGEKRVATLGCLVSDGHTVYALSNKHVTGDAAQIIYSRRRGAERRIGKASGRVLGKKPFTELYPGWSGSNVLVNNDVGLIEIDSVKDWKTEILQIGEIGRLFDLSTQNLSLELIGKRVAGHGAISGTMEGEIFGLFFRYRSIGGKEYVSDYLIGGRDGESLNTHRGDSGTLWMVEETCETQDEKGKKQTVTEYRPIALHWGQFEVQENASALERKGFAMATSLSNLCREMDVEIVRNWNTDQDYSWGKVGHFTIGNKAVVALSGAQEFKKLRDVMTYCQELIGLTLAKLPTSAKYKPKATDFCALADVPDIVWKSKRPGITRFPFENPNHFADIDQKNGNGESLIDLYKQDKNSLNPTDWNDFYKSVGIDMGHRGSLPFRARQIFRAMVEYLENKDLIGYVCAAGVLSHYVGDSCQPLHTSRLHHGEPPDFGNGNIHDLYESRMIEDNADKILSLLDARIKKQQNTTSEKIAAININADVAERLFELMMVTCKKIVPEKMVEVYDPLKGDDDAVVEALWENFKSATVGTIARGSRYLAAFWEAAWRLGDGDSLTAEVNALLAMSKDELKTELKKTYENPDKSKFIPSVYIKDIEQYL